MNSLSISSILTRLMQTKAPLPELDPQASDKKINTTVRLEPQVRAFLDAEAEKLGISTQEFIAMTFKAIMVATHQPVKSELELMLSRFHDLFHQHGIASTDIPTILPAIERSDLLEPSALINKLTPETLTAMAELFFVDLDWLKGTRNYPYLSGGHTWYKHPEFFASKLAYLNRHSLNTRAYFCIAQSTTFDQFNAARIHQDSIDACDMLVITSSERSIEGVAFKQYDLWESQRWNYEPCRLYLKLLMLICQKGMIYFDGVVLPDPEFKALAEGSITVASAMKNFRLWHPDQFLLNDDRNPDRDELPSLERYYDNHAKNLAPSLKALNNPSSVKNWDTCLREGFRFNGEDA